MGEHGVTRLNDVKVRNAKWQPPQNAKNPDAKPPRMMLDGAGLYLKITHSGVKTWVFRYSRKAKGEGDAKEKTITRDLTLGTYPAMSLLDARDERKARADTLDAGGVPMSKREEEAAREAAERAEEAERQRQAKEAEEAAALAEANKITVAQAVALYRADTTYGKTKAGKVWNATHRKQVDRILDLAAKASPNGLGDKEAVALTPDDVKAYLDPIHERTPETFIRTRGVLEAVLNVEQVKKLRGLIANPASRSSLGDQKGEWLYKRGKPTPDNQPAVDYREIPSWFAALRKRKGMAARALEFAALCAARSGEVRGATWDEFIGLDGPEPVWRILGKRMKAGKTHEVPLSPQAVALLNALPRMAGSPYVFPAARGGQLSDMALSMLMRDLQEAEEKAGRRGWLDRENGRPAVPHGLRSAYREFHTANHYDSELGERALAHTAVGTKVSRSYSRDIATEPRRPILAHWARYCYGEEAASGNVVQLHTGAV